MSAAARDWAEAFLAQAREDLEAASTMDQNAAASTFCMLMQMAFEKLAKAIHARSGNVVPKSHKNLAVHLLRVLQRHPSRVPQATPRTLQFVAELETAHPAVAGQLPQPCPQLEYPWEDPATGKVYCPATDLPLARRVRDPRDRITVDILRLAHALESRFDEIAAP